MKLGIMQPYFLPYIGYWQLLNAVDKYVIYDDVNFIKGGWINRNNILLNGESKLINLQLHNASPYKLINEVEVFGSKIYNKKLLRTLENGYKKSPEFNNVFPLIEKIVLFDNKNLAQYLEYSIRCICEFLCIDTELIVSSSINKKNDLKGQDKVIEICKVLGADEYYNAIGGQALYSYDHFSANQVKLNFLKTEIIEYKQLTEEFVPNLSIVDIMMFNTVEEIKKMLMSYRLF